MQEYHWTKETLDVLKSRVRLARFGIHLLTLPVPKAGKDNRLRYKDEYGGHPITLDELHDRAVTIGGCPVDSFFQHINIGDYRSLIPFLFRVDLDVYMMRNHVESITDTVVDDFLFHKDSPWAVRTSVMDWPEYGPKETAYRILHAVSKMDWFDEAWLEALPMGGKQTGLFTSKRSLLSKLVRKSGELEFQRCVLDWSGE